LWTPLIIAASAGHRDIAKMLIGEFVEINKDVNQK
jgi:Ankyrin repeat